MDEDEEDDTPASDFEIQVDEANIPTPQEHKEQVQTWIQPNPSTHAHVQKKSKNLVAKVRDFSVKEQKKAQDQADARRDKKPPFVAKKLQEPAQKKEMKKVVVEKKLDQEQIDFKNYFGSDLRAELAAQEEKK